MSDDRLLWFLHIPKTAGTTFGGILERNFSRRELLDVYPGFGLPLDELSRLPADRVARLRCVRGHFDYGAHRTIDRPHSYVTFLRRPEQQVRSRYNHALTVRRHPLHRLAAERDLAGFVRESPDNFQLRSVLELEPADGRHPPLDESHLERALDQFEREFAVVGLAERFDESLLLMAQRAGLERIHYVRRNVRRRPGREAPEDDAGAKAIEATTALDRRLYAAASERFDDAIAAIPGFDAALALFRRENARYSKRMRLIDAFAHRWAKGTRLLRVVARRVGR